MHPTIFDFNLFGHQFHVYSYGFCLGLSFVLGWHLAAWFAAKDGMSIDKLKGAVFIVILGALFFSRVAFYLAAPEKWEGARAFFKVWDGGLVAYGGIVGGILVAYFYFPLRGLDFWLFAENAAPSLAMGLMLTRIGCLMRGCDFGTVTDVAWALQFPAGSPAWEEHVGRNLIQQSATHSLPVHPTQIYESLVGLTCLLILLFVRRFKRRFNGQSLFLFLGLYAIFRFCLEFLRDDPQRGFWGSGIFRLSTSQYVAIITLAVAVFFTLRPPQDARVSNPRTGHAGL